MGVFDELARILRPHSDRLNENLATQGALLHGRLTSIEDAVSDLNRPDFGDKWLRRAFIAGEELQVPMNEIWLVQSLVLPTVANVTLLANGITVFIGTKKTAEYYNIGGNIVFLPGDVIEVTGGNITCHIVRHEIPKKPQLSHSGHSGHRLGTVNTHDPARDEIRSRTGQYVEPGPEVENDAGRPPLVDPTSV